jgi:glycosyltransferase involved in cell wall biosynthesis
VDKMALPFYNNLEALLQSVGAPSSSIRKRSKVLLVSTHAHQCTGYSKVSQHLVKELAKESSIELFHFGFQKAMASSPDWRAYPSNVDVFDVVAKEKECGKAEGGFGFSLLPNEIKRIQPDYVFLYNDASVMCQFLDSLEKNLTSEERSKYKMLIYFDQVYDCQRPQLLGRIDKDAHAYFAFTEYWKTVLQAQGITKPIHILRHGFDPTQFVPKDRMELRKKHNLPEDAILFLNVNRNTPRKHYDLLIMAFAQLVARHPTQPVILMCVCDAGEHGGYPIMEIYVRELSLLKVPAQAHIQKLAIVRNAMSFTDEMINDMYAMSDVGVSTADGEGFGLCQFEAMGIGIPQVVPYVGGFKDFCKHDVNAKVIKPVFRTYVPLVMGGIGGISELVDPKEVCFAMEEYMMDSDLRAKHGAAARKTILDYEWKKEVQSLVKVVTSP